MNSNFDTATIQALLLRLQHFANSFEPFTSFESTAQRMLFARSATAFRAAGILCYEGLFVDSYNSARVALEAGWLALILRRSDELSREWLTLVPRDTSDSEIEKRYRKTFGNLAWIRETVSQDNAELVQKTNIYQLLSTKSHANPAAMVFAGSIHNNIDDLTLYPSEPLDSEAHRTKFLSGILYCLKYLLYDVQNHCGVDFNVSWNYDERSLFNIAGVAYPDQNHGIKVVPEKVNAMYQSMILLQFAKKQDNGDR